MPFIGIFLFLHKNFKIKCKKILIKKIKKVEKYMGGGV